MPVPGFHHGDVSIRSWLSQKSRRLILRSQCECVVAMTGVPRRWKQPLIDPYYRPRGHDRESSDLSADFSPGLA